MRDEPRDEAEDLPQPAGNEDEDEDELPESPYPLDPDVEYMVADEILAVRLGGAAVGADSIAMEIAAPFLFRLHILVGAIASRITGREPGTRGPLPEVEGAGLLAFARLQPGSSVTFHFGIGPGEEYRLTPSGETSTTQEVINIVTEFVERTAAADEEELLGLSRDLGERVSNAYFELVQTMSRSRVHSAWLTPAADAPIAVPVERLRQAEVILRREALPHVDERVLTGWLYRADAKEHRFLFAREEYPDERLPGTYREELREDVRRAWDQLVEIDAIVTEERFLRHEQPHRTVLELVRLRRIVGEHE